MEFQCADGYVLHGHCWKPDAADSAGMVVIAPATGVKAAYYHRYAAFLAAHGFTAVTFDYRGIGASRPAGKLPDARWYQWGLLDIDAVLGWALERAGAGTVQVVGHSFGGFGTTLAARSAHLSRMLTVGAQHAFWPDYHPAHRGGYWWRWHAFMPVAAVLRGHFPGRRLGWLEDLPRGVALDWARSRRDFTRAGGPADRAAMRAHLAAFTAPVLAIAATDDPYATRTAMARALAYCPNSASEIVQLDPAAYGLAEIGHFSLFHSRFEGTFWPDTLAWLVDGRNPWDR